MEEAHGAVEQVREKEGPGKKDEQKRSTLTNTDSIKGTSDTRAAEYLSQSLLNTVKYLLQGLPLQMNISERCTGEDHTNRGCHICRFCSQKQLVVTGGAHVPYIHCNSKPGVN